MLKRTGVGGRYQTAIAAVLAMFVATLAVPASASPPPAVRAAVASVVPGDGLSAGQSWVWAVYEDFLGRAPSDAELSAGAALAPSAPGSLVGSLSTSQGWLSHIVSGFYTDKLGRAPDQAGLEYWVGVIGSGRLSVAQVAAAFYASGEYFSNLGGGTNASWVTDLYRKLLHREPDAGGLSYWVGLTASQGRFAVAYSFFQSLESRLDRVKALYEDLLDRDPDPAGQRYWADAVLGAGDVALAQMLAVSAEYQSLATLVYGGRATILGPAADSQAATPTGTSDEGHVVGYVGQPNFDTGAVWWSDEDGYAVARSMQGPVGATQSYPEGITSDGRVYGYVTTSDHDHAAVWPSAEGAPVVLLDPAGATDARAVGILPDGTVIGWSRTSTGDRAVSWPAATALAAPSYLASPPGLAQVEATAVGADGSILGYGYTHPFHVFALHWTSSDASPTVLSTPTGVSWVQPVGASSQGVIVGNMGLGSEGPLAWPSPSAQPIQLRPPAGLHGAGVFGVTADGWIVGQAGDDNDLIHLVVWRTPTAPGVVIQTGPDLGSIFLGLSGHGVSPGARVVGTSPPALPVQTAFLFTLGS